MLGAHVLRIWQLVLDWWVASNVCSTPLVALPILFQSATPAGVHAEILLAHVALNSDEKLAKKEVEWRMCVLLSLKRLRVMI